MIARFNCPTTTWHPQGSSPKSWFINLKRIQIAKRWKPIWKRIKRVQPVQRKVEGHDPRHGEHGAFRDVPDRFQSIVPQLLNKLNDSDKTSLRLFRHKSQIEQIGFMFHRFRTTWWRRDHLTVHVTETQRNKTIMTQFTTQQRRRGRKHTKPHWTDFWTARVIENHQPLPHPTKFFAAVATRLQPKIILISQHRQNGPETKILGSLF